MRYGPTAIAGFTIITVATVVGMADSVVTTLYASAASPDAVRRRLIPAFSDASPQLGAKSGVLINALLVANTVDVSPIASVGSACPMMIFVLPSHSR